jgi:MFS transporter, putative metabolite transport protein
MLAGATLTPDSTGQNHCAAVLVGTSLLGAVVTWLFRIDTTGVNLEQIGK